MAFLEQFPAAERDLLVSLVYRAGLWVSRAGKQEEGDRSRAETAALESLFQKKARGLSESVFVREVMAETYALKSMWPVWDRDQGDVPADCERAVQLISSRLIRRDTDAYRESIMQIAIEVSRIFRVSDRYARLPFRLGLGTWLSGMRRLMGTAGREVYAAENLENISFEEDVALSVLARALATGTENDSLEDEMRTGTAWQA